MSEWIRVSKELPEEKEVVETKIDDEEGVRNIARLFRYRNLWFIEGSSSMYVYYTPTHWRTTKR